MSDSPVKKAAAGAWTDADKLGLLFSIVDTSVDKIDWKSVQLPEGRTLKACTVWLDKQRFKKTKAAEGGENGEEGAEPKTPAKPKKRGAKAATEGEDGEESTPKAKKAKTPRKTKTPSKVKAGADDTEEKSDGSEGEKVKSEVESSDMVF